MITLNPSVPKSKTFQRIKKQNLPQFSCGSSSEIRFGAKKPPSRVLGLLASLATLVSLAGFTYKVATDLPYGVRTSRSAISKKASELSKLNSQVASSSPGDYQVIRVHEALTTLNSPGLEAVYQKFTDAVQAVREDSQSVAAQQFVTEAVKQLGIAANILESMQGGAKAAGDTLQTAINPLLAEMTPSDAKATREIFAKILTSTDTQAMVLSDQSNAIRRWMQQVVQPKVPKEQFTLLNATVEKTLIAYQTDRTNLSLQTLLMALFFVGFFVAAKELTRPRPLAATQSSVSLS
ncbi:MAG: hypothetical protein K2X01_05070 [Cyanobacteria bacterium]|nr:hypothetical protein [Cyanobacteriota bacterium]